MRIALAECVTMRGNYEVGCRILLACGAGVHWVGALLLLSDHAGSNSTWEYAPRALHLIASTVLQRLLQI